MLPGPDEMARQIQHRHRPGWLVWYGRATGQFWAMAAWARRPYGLVCAPTPDLLDAAIATFETFHPKPPHSRAHGLDH
jgi:hypothetical protein